MKFELNLYIILVFLVPGALGLVALTFWIPAAAKMFHKVMADPNTALAVFLLSLSFIIGAFVDSIRAVILDPLTQKLSGYSVPKDYLSKMTKDNVVVFELLLARTQEYYRLNANSTIALLLAEFSYVITKGFHWVLLPGIVLLILLFIASVQTKKAANWAMDQFSKSGGGQ